MLRALSPCYSWEASALRQSLVDAYGSVLPVAWIDSIVSQTSDGRPAQSMGLTVQVSRFHGPKMVLVGDAGHAMTNATRQAR